MQKNVGGAIRRTTLKKLPRPAFGNAKILLSS